MKPSLTRAATHPPEYRLHKYWARKPHNLLRQLLKGTVGEGDLVIDPFCGSGVLLREAALLGCDAIGIDINPAATLVSRVTVSPPDVIAFDAAARRILALAARLSAKAYAYGEGSPVRYCVHELVTACSTCGAEISASNSNRSGKSYSCPNCESRLRFNLESMIRTQVTGVSTASVEVEQRASTLALQERLSLETVFDDTTPYDREFPQNRRTLTFKGLMTSQLFTPRNFSILCAIAASIDDVADEDVRDALLMWLTASVAQCSRLIAFRGGLATGGPAWSVPGFWVPPVHLETNPWIHLAARLKKFEAGLKALASRPIGGTATVVQEDATVELERLRDEGHSAKLIFLDPPYGDSVPYLEFSALWNSFLRETPSYGLDISVSDRVDEPSGWTDYARRLHEIIGLCSDLLGPTGSMLITFNNNDPRAWISIVEALQAAGLRCSNATYQTPAVVSSKAQFAPATSYLGDIYCLFKQGTQQLHRDLAPVKESLRRLASSRGGRVRRNIVSRVATVSFLEFNIHASLFKDVPALLEECFSRDDDHYAWLGELDTSSPNVFEVVTRSVKRHLALGSFELETLEDVVASELGNVLAPDLAEIRSMIDSLVNIQGGTCRALPSDQLRLNLSALEPH